VVLGCDDAAPELGGPCRDVSECPASPRAACVLFWPDGYCAELACTLGSCPGGARCVSGFDLPDVAIDSLCLAVCDASSDCREGYRCTEIGQPEKVCAPARS
jgi:hypothetical protein